MASDLARNYFELFGIPPDFDVDLDVLTQRYRDLQRAAHPDRFAQAAAQERRLAVQHAADINDGFRTLKDPVERALHLLRIKDFAVDAHASAQLDPQFLMEQMELREALAHARHGANAAAALKDIHAAIGRLEAQITHALRTNFKTGDAKALTAAFGNVQKLRFVQKLRAETRDAEEDAGH